MMVVGTALFLVNLSGILNSRATCQDYMVMEPARLYPPHCEPTIFPGFYLSSADGFIMIVLSLCLMAFGGVIVGMIIRLQK
jgi:hypothetical protein